MKVEVHLLFPFRAEVGEEPVSLETPSGADVARALATLVDRFPQLQERIYDPKGRVHRHIAALVNGTAIQFKEGLATPLSDGDVLTLLPPVGGG